MFKQQKTEMIDSEGVKIASPKRRLFGRKYKSVYGDQLVCLIALLIMAVWRWGLRALMLTVVSVAVSMLADLICCRLTRKTYNYRDLSTVVSGMCLALMMPASISYTYLIFGSALAMGIKHIFGGKNNYVFNPACLSYAFLAVCWPSQILMYPKIGETIPVFGEYSGTLSSGMEFYLVRLGTTQQLSSLDILLGNFLGAIGTTHVLILVVCGICLMFRRALSPIITLVTFGTFAALSLLFPAYDNIRSAIIIELISGNLLFGLIFLANDPQTMPRSALGRVFYGIIMGALLVIFRHMTQTETSFVFVLLIANAASLHIDRFADKTIVVTVNTFKWLKNSAGSYERVKKRAQNGDPSEKKTLGDTQEIIVPLMNYNMPAVDNKIIKAAKKPPKIIKGKNSVPMIKEESFFSSLRKNFGKARGGKRSPSSEAKSLKPKKFPIRQPKKNKDNKKGKE